jgi:hypothetical protein
VFLEFGLANEEDVNIVTGTPTLTDYGTYAVNNIVI